MRYRGELINSSVMSVIFFVFYGGFYPKDEVGDLVAVMQKFGILSGISAESAGWSIWLSIMLGLIGYMIIAITAINMGSRVIPTRDKVGAEYMMGSTDIDPRKYYIENIVSSTGVLFLSMIPGYIVILVETFILGSGENLDRISIAYAMFILIGFFFISFTSAVVAWRFERGLALGVGYSYIFFGLILDLFGDNPNIDLGNLGNLAVNKYLKISQIPITEGKIDWEPSFWVLVVSLFFIFLGYLSVKRPQYVEKVMSKQKTSIVEATVGYFVRPTSRFSKRFPLIAEQMRKDQKAVFIMTLIYLIYIPVLMSSIVALGNDLSSIASSLNSPSTLMMTQGVALDSSLLSFAVLKVFMASWLWYGLFSLFVAASIPTRDIRTNSQDLIYGTTVSPGKLMDRRTIAMFIEFLTLMVISYLVFVVSIYANGIDFAEKFMTWDVLLQYTVLTLVHFSGVFIMVIAVAMLPREVAKGRRYSLLFFFVSLLLDWIAYSEPSISVIKYVSVFEYYNPIPVLYGEMSFGIAMLRATIVLLISLFFYGIAKKYRYKDSSLY